MSPSKSPLVSIVIPVYNREDLVVESIESALSQTYLNCEIIVVDNFSTDSTSEVISALHKKHPKISIYRQTENVGPVRNWHSAISKAKGEYLKILFSDDLMYPEFLEETVEQFSNDVGFIITSFDMGKDTANTILGNDWPGIDGLISSHNYIERALSRFAFLVSPGAAIFRTSDVLEVFEEEIPSPRLSNFRNHGAGPDLLIFLKIANKYPYVYKSKKSLVLFRDHFDSQTNKMNKSRDGLIQSSYMQARIYFAEKFYPQLRTKMLGKALFVELFQNRNMKAISINWLVSAYSLEQKYSALWVLAGFISAFKNAVYEIFRRLFRSRKTE